MASAPRAAWNTGETSECWAGESSSSPRSSHPRAELRTSWSGETSSSPRCSAVEQLVAAASVGGTSHRHCQDFENDVLKKLNQIEAEISIKHNVLCERLDHLCTKGAWSDHANEDELKRSYANLLERMPHDQNLQTKQGDEPDLQASSLSPSDFATDSERVQQVTASLTIPNIRPRASRGESSSAVFVTQNEDEAHGRASSKPDRQSRSSRKTVSNNDVRSRQSRRQDSDNTDDMGGEAPMNHLTLLNGTHMTHDLAIKAIALFTRRPQVGHWALKIWNFLEDPESSFWAGVLDATMPYFLFSMVFFAVAQSVEPPPIPEPVCAIIDISVDMLFLFEIIVRYVVCPSRGMTFFLRPFNIIDIVAVMPLALRIYLINQPALDSDRDWHVFLYCMVPVLRLLKMMRRFEKIHLLLGAFKLAWEALPVLMFILTLYVLTFASAVYLLEPRDNIEHLPKAIWFTVVTMTTVGYGDVVPVSTPGTCVVMVLTVSSVLYMAMPLGIVGQAFTQVWSDRDRILLVKKSKAALAQWGYTAWDMPVLCQIFDTEGKDELNLTDFCRMIRMMRIGLKKKRVIELFDTFDLDGSGSIDSRELVRQLFPQSYHDLYGKSAHTASPHGDDIPISQLASLTEGQPPTTGTAFESEGKSSNDEGLEKEMLIRRRISKELQDLHVLKELTTNPQARASLAKSCSTGSLAKSSSKAFSQESGEQPMDGSDSPTRSWALNLQEKLGMKRTSGESHASGYSKRSSNGALRGSVLASEASLKKSASKVWKDPSKDASGRKKRSSKTMGSMSSITSLGSKGVEEMSVVPSIGRSSTTTCATPTVVKISSRPFGSSIQ